MTSPQVIIKSIGFQHYQVLINQVSLLLYLQAANRSTSSMWKTTACKNSYKLLQCTTFASKGHSLTRRKMVFQCILQIILFQSATKGLRIGTACTSGKISSKLYMNFKDYQTYLSCKALMKSCLKCMQYQSSILLLHSEIEWFAKCIEKPFSSCLKNAPY